MKYFNLCNLKSLEVFLFGFKYGEFEDLRNVIEIYFLLLVFDFLCVVFVSCFIW